VPQTIRNPQRAEFGDEASAAGADGRPDFVVLLEDGDRNASARDTFGGSEPGRAGSGDDDVGWLVQQLILTEGLHRPTEIMVS
jgi:hypothetical protein